MTLAGDSETASNSVPSVQKSNCYFNKKKAFFGMGNLLAGTAKQPIILRFCSALTSRYCVEAATSGEASNPHRHHDVTIVVVAWWLGSQLGRAFAVFELETDIRFVRSCKKIQ